MSPNHAGGIRPDVRAIEDWMDWTLLNIGALSDQSATMSSPPEHDGSRQFFDRSRSSMCEEATVIVCESRARESRKPVQTSRKEFAKRRRNANKSRDLSMS